MRPFPEKFDYEKFRLAAERFKPGENLRPEDVFQTMVGDWLTLLDSRVNAFPTLGEDGGIDHYIEHELARPDDLFQGAAYPIAVECKYSSRNIKAFKRELKKTKNKIDEQIENGLHKNYRPWRNVNGYLFCISFNFSTQAQRDNLLNDIKEFFAKHRAAGNLRVEWVALTDWGNLRAAFNKHAALKNRWLPVDDVNDVVIDQQSLEANFSRVAKYLSPTRLPFAPPPEDSPFAPQNILRQLESCESLGVLLSGAGGVGKTRTAFETGRLALDAGWTVVHFQRSAGQGSAENLLQKIADTVLPDIQGRKLLLVIDYLDLCNGLNDSDEQGGLQSQYPQDAARECRGVLRILADAARERGGLLRILALTRPQALTGKANLWLYRFDKVEVTPDSTQKGVIVDRILECLAPRATEKLGYDALRGIVGQRPIIALFIALEIEKRFDGLGVTADFTGILAEARRNGTDLSRWLEDRLRRDELLPDPVKNPGSWRARAQPLEPLVAAMAAILAAAPLATSKLPAIADAILSKAYEYGNTIEYNDDELRHKESKKCLETLIDMGWLEEDEGFAHAAHDVIADELTRQCLMDPVYEGAMRPRMPGWFLTPATQDVRVLGRYADTFYRALYDLPGTTRQELERQLIQWFRDQRAALEELFHQDTPDAVSYALGAALGSPLMAAGLNGVWDQLISPWLNTIGRTEPARHFLSRFLRTLPDGAFPGHAAPYRHWLLHNWDQPGASHVLKPLLDRKDLADSAAPVILAAMTWLKKFAETEEARFVLGALLPRDDLGDHAETAINDAMKWLEKFAETEVARFVLGTLLPRDDLGEYDKNAIKIAINHAMTWLKKFAETEVARFILGALLPRDDLGDHAENAINHAMKWLKKFAETEEARFVLGALLPRDDLGGHAETAINHAMTWLKKFAETEEARFVLSALLPRDDLGDHAKTAINHAMKWLEKFAETEEASFVLGALLPRDGLGDHAETAINHAMKWLEKFAETEEASFVLGPLLPHDDLGDHTQNAINHAMKWLADNIDKTGADFVLRALLPRNDLGGHAETAINHAMTWLALPGRAVSADASYVLKPLFKHHAGLTAEQQAAFNAAAAAWAMDHWQESGADFIINRVLRSPILNDEDWRALATRAQQRMAEAPSRDDASTVAALLTRPRLLGGDAAARPLLTMVLQDNAPNIPLSHPAKLALLRWLHDAARSPDDAFAPLAPRVAALIETQWSLDQWSIDPPALAANWLDPLEVLAERHGDAALAAQVARLRQRASARRP